MDKKESVAAAAAEQEEKALPVETPAAEKAVKKDNKDGTKYSVKTYVLILFSVVILLIALSYLIQQRNFQNLSEQHSVFSTQALQNIDNLQKQNIALVEENEDLQDRIEALQAAAERAKAAADKQKADYAELEKKYQAVTALSQLQAAAKAEDSEAAAEAAETLEDLQQYLTEEQAALYAELKDALKLDEE